MHYLDLNVKAMEAAVECFTMWNIQAYNFTTLNHLVKNCQSIKKNLLAKINFILAFL